MMPIAPVSPNLAALGVTPVQPAPPSLPDGLTAAPAAPSDGFSRMLDGLISSVDKTQAQSEAVTTRVLLGDSGQLHQSMIAMQEATTALDLMVTVRNKLVESYQELMRMQV